MFVVGNVVYNVKETPLYSVNWVTGEYKVDDTRAPQSTHDVQNTLGFLRAENVVRLYIIMHILP